MTALETALVAALFAGAADAGTGARAEPASSATTATRICRSVVGAAPGTTQFGACYESMTRSAAVLASERRLGASRDACLRRGLSPDTPDGAQCVLANSRATAAAPAPAGTIPASAPARSYMSASPAEAHRRFETACASLGYDPASRGFDACVTRLHSSMFQADNPVD
jgi:hypothetical protein